MVSATQAAARLNTPKRVRSPGETDTDQAAKFDKQSVSPDQPNKPQSDGSGVADSDESGLPSPATWRADPIINEPRDREQDPQGEDLLKV